MSSPFIKTALRGFLKYSLAVIVFFAAMESLIRIAYFFRDSYTDVVVLPYVMMANYGPIPPWLKRESMLTLDDKFVWTGTPHFHRKYMDNFKPVDTNSDRYSLLRNFIPSIPDYLRNQPTWEMSLNSEGFRDNEFPKEKLPSEFRIVCLGDSWTVGSNVNRDESYPYLLEELLNREYPNLKFEVFNLGVFGYTSLQGLKLMDRALELKPDIIVTGFAMNEADISNSIKYIEGDGKNSARKAKTFSHKIITYVSNNSELYKLLRYWALILKWKPDPMNDYFKSTLGAAEYYKDIEDEDKQEPWLKDILKKSEQNFLDMISIARKNNIDVVLLYPEFSREGPHLKILKKISFNENIPLVDGSNLIAGERQRIEENLEKNLGLKPDNYEKRYVTVDKDMKVIFRVYVEDYSVPDRMYITGTLVNLGNLTPNKIAMYDDGTHGDQRAGDRVWSYSAKFPIGTKIFYVYTNSGTEGKWDGLDLPDIRYIKVEPITDSSVLYAPIDTFGKMYMKADAWHPNPLGNKLIAEAVFQKVIETTNLKNYINRESHADQ
jgi:lysophospholipase L1-like esterase